MVTIQNAAIYSTNGAMAYELTYSEGTQVRALQTSDGWMRKEHKNNRGEWVLSGKPYIVKANRRRAAEIIRQSAIDFLA